MYYHFSYTSGANPYIAKTEKERDRIIKKHETAGEIVTETQNGFYIIDDNPAQNREGMEHIKANLPANAADYETGNGEGVFILVDAATKEAHDSDATGAGYTGILDNDSFYYKGLLHGVIVPLEMRGVNRPVVPFEWLITNYEINAFEVDDGPAEIRNGDYYYFDCLTDIGGDNLRQADSYDSDKAAIMEAADLEATLLKYRFINGECVETITLYEPGYL